MIKVYAACGWHMLNRKRGGDLGGAREQKYSLEELKAAASTCSYRTEFKKKFSAMYSFILYHDLRDEVFGDMSEFFMPPLYWTDDKLWEAVKGCNYSKAEFDNILGWCLGQNHLCEYIEGDLSFLCVIAGFNAAELTPKYPDFISERVYALGDATRWCYEYGKECLFIK